MPERAPFVVSDVTPGVGREKGEVSRRMDTSICHLGVSYR